jgi:hypothetical protein
MLLFIVWHGVCDLLLVCSFFSLARRWPSDSPSYSGTLGDMFDYDSSEHLTSGTVGGIGSGRQIMKASRLVTRLASL